MSLTPLVKESASPEVHAAYEVLTKKFGKMPNIFGMMAHRPGVLSTFLPMFGAIMERGTIEPRFKELAYLKTSMLNGCEY